MENNIWTPIAILVAGLMISVTNIQSGKNIKANVPTAPTQPVAPKEEEGPLSGVITNFPKVARNEHIKGSTNPRYYWVEYSDFDCPFCKQFHSTMDNIVKKYDGKISWVYRGFPIDGLHPESRAKSEAAECVAEQKGNDGFWAFTDSVLQDGVTTTEAAKRAGVDMAKFNACVDSKKYAKKVSDVINAGNSVGVRGTPAGFLVDAKTGKAIKFNGGAAPQSVIESIIDGILKDGIK